jgi:antitoxin component YwqK of YwqJK toxin-antitoxin module
MNSKYYFSSLLSGLLILGIAGCGGGDSSVETPEGDPTGSERQNVPGGAEETGESQARLAQEALSVLPPLPEESGPKIEGVEAYEVNFDGDTQRPKIRAQRQMFADGRFQLHGPYKEWYLSQKPLVEGEYKDGAKDGKWTYWYENGQIAKTGNFVDGKQEGSWVYWLKDGNKEREVNFRAGKKDGKWLEYYPDGTLHSEKHFSNGIAQGEHKSWHENGQESVVSHYKDGKLDGVQKMWNEQGQLLIESNMRMGQSHGTLRRWDDNGAILSDQRYEDGRIVEPKRPE